MAVIGEVLDPIIENALRERGERKVDSTDDNLKGETLLSHLVKLTDGKHHFLVFRLYIVLCLPRPQDYPRRDV